MPYILDTVLWIVGRHGLNFSNYTPIVLTMSVFHLCASDGSDIVRDRLIEKVDNPMPNQNYDAGSDANAAGRCRICAQPAQDDRCAHHLGAFSDEGRYGIGLVGGALYDVREIGDVFNAVRVDYAKARIGGKSYTTAVPDWCKKDPALKKYVRSFRRAELFDPGIARAA